MKSLVIVQQLQPKDRPVLSRCKSSRSGQLQLWSSRSKDLILRQPFRYVCTWYIIWYIYTYMYIHVNKYIYICNMYIYRYPNYHISYVRKHLGIQWLWLKAQRFEDLIPLIFLWRGSNNLKTWKRCRRTLAKKWPRCGLAIYPTHPSGNSTSRTGKSSLFIGKSRFIHGWMTKGYRKTIN